ncbi:unnamed protein product [Blepharisma stoltei]|uniref:Uncharacterized protein n=1 Tax=Blepharisma stoltei TaxID=1481888 RepID=A0AAU9IA46_9CILI|nr:unnamed protein product [Blepharisma stoltei]
MDKFVTNISNHPDTSSPINRHSPSHAESQIKRLSSKQNLLKQYFKQELSKDLTSPKSQNFSNKANYENNFLRQNSPNAASTPRSRSFIAERSLSTAAKKRDYKNTQSRIDSGIKGKRSTTPKFIPLLKNKPTQELSKSYMSERSLTPNIDDSRENLNGVDYLTQEVRLKKRQGQISPIKAIKDFLVKISRSHEYSLEQISEFKEKIELVLELIFSYKALSHPFLHPTFAKMTKIMQEIQVQLNHNEYIPIPLLVQCDDIIASLETQIANANCFSPGLCTRKGLEDAEENLNAAIGKVTVKTLKDFRAQKFPGQDIQELAHSFLILVSEVDSHVTVSSGFKVMKSRLWEVLQKYTSNVGQVVQTIRKIPNFIKEGKIRESVIFDAYSHFSKFNPGRVKKVIGAEEILNLLNESFEYYGRFKEFKTIHQQEVPNLPLYKLSSPKKPFESISGSPSFFGRSGSKMNIKTDACNTEESFADRFVSQEKSDTPRFAFGTFQSPQKINTFELTLSKCLDAEANEEEHKFETENSPQIIIDTQDELDVIIDTFESVQNSSVRTDQYDVDPIIMTEPCEKTSEMYNPHDIESVVTTEPASDEKDNFDIYSTPPIKKIKEIGYFLSPDVSSTMKKIEKLSSDLQSQNFATEKDSPLNDSLAYSSKDSPYRYDTHSYSTLSTYGFHQGNMSLEHFESPSDRVIEGIKKQTRSASSHCLSSKYYLKSKQVSRKEIPVSKERENIRAQWDEVREKKRKAEEDKRKEFIEESNAQRNIEEKFQALMTERIKQEREMIKQTKMQEFEESKRIKALKEAEKKKEILDEIQRNIEKSELGKNSKDVEKGLLRKTQPNHFQQKNENELFQKLILREGNENRFVEKMEYSQEQKGILKEQVKLQRILSRLSRGY